MRRRVDQNEILDPIVLLVPVEVMDVEAPRDRAIMLLPDQPMDVAATTIEPDLVITVLGRIAKPRGVLRFRSSPHWAF
jgi:hypothetical protein